MRLTVKVKLPVLGWWRARRARQRAAESQRAFVTFLQRSDGAGLHLGGSTSARVPCLCEPTSRRLCPIHGPRRRIHARLG